MQAPSPACWTIALSPRGGPFTGIASSPAVTLSWQTADDDGKPVSPSPLAERLRERIPVQKAAPLWALPAAGESRVIDLPGNPAEADGACTLAFSPDSRTLATVLPRDGTVRLWDVTTGEELHSLKGDGTAAVAWSSAVPARSWSARRSQAGPLPAVPRPSQTTTTKP